MADWQADRASAVTVGTRASYDTVIAHRANYYGDRDEQWLRRRQQHGVIPRQRRDIGHAGDRPALLFGRGCTGLVDVPSWAS